VAASKIVPKQFIDDFELVSDYYGFKEAGEYEIAKEAARNDLESAIVCFAAMAKHVRFMRAA